MYVSGITVSKRPTLNLNKKGVSTDPRPVSSQLPQIMEARRTDIKMSKNMMEQQQKKYNSSSKIPMNNRLKQKKSQNLQKDKKLVNFQLRQPNLKKRQLQIQTKPKTNKSLILQINQNQQKKVLAYFRYYPISIIGACGKKQQLFKNLQETGKFKVIDGYQKQKKCQQSLQGWNKLLKLAQLKGKYKYRQKFNYLYSVQLKAINYKRKQWKKKKQSSSSSSESDGDHKEKCRDKQTWKKAMGVEGKIFIIKGKYKDLKNALLERGWIENQDKYSIYYDLKWTTKVNDVNFETLTPGQMVNHFNNNACLTSKYGLCKSLRSILYSQQVDIDQYFPKAYDLTDLSDFQNFLEIYKWVYCQSLLKKYLIKQNGKEIEQLYVKVALIVTLRRISIRNIQDTINNIIQNKYFLCSINQWNCLNQLPYDIQEIQKSLSKYQLTVQNQSNQRLKTQVQIVLNQLKQIQPQYDLNGSNNIWIVKPAFLSRGRGIKCLSDFNQILDYSMGKDTQYVVQKYIENPLLINKKKFDIRQWVLVQDFNPPKIWFYGQFYLRFCMDQYSIQSIGNKYAHLTNNSIQKTNKKKVKQDPQALIQSMWTQQQFKQYLQSLNQYQNTNIFSKIISKMKEIVIGSIIGVQDQVYGRKNSFELIGYDFMIDSNMNPWLIQINSSPSMDYSTPVTRRLVQMVLEDTVKVVVDQKMKKNNNPSKKKKTCGLFKCIYKGDQKKLKNYKIFTQSIQ